MLSSTINIYNPADVELYLRGLAHDVRDHDKERVSDLLVVALRKAIINENIGFEVLSSLPKNAPDWLVQKWEKGTFQSFNPERIPQEAQDKIINVKRWLEKSLIQQRRNPEDPLIGWLNPDQADNKDRPKKLLKFGSIEQAHDEAEKARSKNEMRIEQADPSYKIIEADKHSEIIYRMANGFAIVKILGSEGLAIEGDRMHHCMNPDTRNEDYEYIVHLSLRDRHNEPHVTFEIEYDDSGESNITQCRGKGDKSVSPKYYKYLKDFAMRTGCSLSEKSSYTGLVRTVNPRYSIIDELPERCETRGAFDISEIGRTIIFPKGMRVNGDVSLNLQTYLENKNNGTLPKYAGMLNVTNYNEKGKCNNFIMDDGTVIAAVHRLDKDHNIVHRKYIVDGPNQNMLLDDGTLLPSVQDMNAEGKLISLGYYNGQRDNPITPEGLEFPAIQEYDHAGISLKKVQYYKVGKEQPDTGISEEFLLQNKEILESRIKADKAWAIMNIFRENNPNTIDVNSAFTQQTNDWAL